MRTVDRWLQAWRIRMAAPWIPKGARVLDVGCGDGVLFEKLGWKLASGVGIDPRLDTARDLGAFQLRRGVFPDDAPLGPFDAITMLAVLEHVPRDRQPPLVESCSKLLVPGGHVIVSVPQPMVDRWLEVLKRLRLVDAESLDEHYGFDTATTSALFEAGGLELLCHRRFQLGLNNLYVFQKPAAP